MKAKKAEANSNREIVITEDQYATLQKEIQKVMKDKFEIMRSYLRTIDIQTATISSQASLIKKLMKGSFVATDFGSTTFDSCNEPAF